MYAWIENGVIRDLAVDPHKQFHTTIAANYSTEVPDGVKTGFILVDGTWQAPPKGPEAPVEPSAPEVEPVTRVSPVEFKLCFTPTERIAIRQLRATDPAIDDFFDILDDPRLSVVDLTLTSTVNGVDYILNALQVGGVLTAEAAATRRGEILSGVFQ